MLPQIDASSRRIVVDGKSTRLEPKAFSVLEALIAAKGRVVGRQQLLDRCWEEGCGSDEALTQAIAQIRRALSDDAGNPRFILTVPKSGYRWMSPAQPPAPPAPPAPPLPPAPPPRRPSAVPFLWLAVAAMALGAAALPLLLPMRKDVEIVLVKKGKEGTTVERRRTAGSGEP